MKSFIKLGSRKNVSSTKNKVYSFLLFQFVSKKLIVMTQNWVIQVPSSMNSSLGLWPSGFGNYFVCKRFAVQTLLRSPEFLIQVSLEHDTNVV